MAIMRKVRREPRQKKIGKIIKAKVARRTSPEIGLFENCPVADEGRGSNRARAGSSRLPAKPRGNPKKAGKPHPKEHRAPAVFRNQQTGTERADGRPELQAGGNYTVGQASAFRWNVLGNQFGCAGKCNR